MLKGLYNITKNVLNTAEHSNNQLIPYAPPFQQGFGTGSMTTAIEDTFQNGSSPVQDTLIDIACQNGQALLQALQNKLSEAGEIAEENPAITGGLIFASTLAVTYGLYRCCSNKTSKLISDNIGSDEESSVEESDKDKNTKTKKLSKSQ